MDFASAFHLQLAIIIIIENMGLQHIQYSMIIIIIIIMMKVEIVTLADTCNSHPRKKKETIGTGYERKSRSLMKWKNFLFLFIHN